MQPEWLRLDSAQVSRCSVGFDCILGRGVADVQKIAHGLLEASPRFGDGRPDLKLKADLCLKRIGCPPHRAMRQRGAHVRRRCAVEQLP